MWDSIAMQLEKPSFWQKYKGKVLLVASSILLTTFISNPLNETEARTNFTVNESIKKQNITIQNPENTVLGKLLPTGKTKVINKENYHSKDDENSEVIAANFQLLKLARTSSKTLSEKKLTERTSTEKTRKQDFLKSVQKQKIAEKQKAIKAPKMISEMGFVKIKKQKKKRTFSTAIVINLKKGAFKNQEAAPENKRSKVGHFIQQVNKFRHGEKATFKRVQ